MFRIEVSLEAVVEAVRVGSRIGCGWVGWVGWVGIRNRGSGLGNEARISR